MSLLFVFSPTLSLAVLWLFQLILVAAYLDTINVVFGVKIRASLKCLIS